MDSRQRVIVFQSSLQRAFEILQHNLKDQKIDVDMLLAAAERISDGALEYATSEEKDIMKEAKRKLGK